MDSIDDSPPSPLPAPIPASAQQVPALPADLADRLTRLGDEQRRQVLEVLRATLGVAENAKPLGAPIATEHQQTLQQLSDQAEAQHAASKQRRRPAGG